MVWLIRNRTVRKPAVLVGAACTGMLVGFFVFDKLAVFPGNGVQRKLISSESGVPPKVVPRSTVQPTIKSPSFVELEKHQLSQEIRGSTLKKLDAVFLGSNSPIEDRFSVGVTENLNLAIVSIIDGHRGTHCSQHLQTHLNQKISGVFHDQLGLKDDFLTVADMDKAHASNVMDGNSSARFADVVLSHESDTSKIEQLSLDTLQQCLKDTFVDMDAEVSNSALNEVKRISSGHFMSAEMKSTILTAVEGACALTAVVQEGGVSVAGTGDCRVVLGHRRNKSEWEAVPLSEDQNVNNKKEVDRLLKLHPGEEDTVIARGRVLGNLMPFRTFGDVDHKWEAKYLAGVLSILPYYKTPPYVTAEPVLSRREFVEGDKFLIFATDGLWERMTNQEAVEIVAGVCETTGNGGASCHGKENAATHLLWHALGGTETNVSRLLAIDPRISRMYRDDITIMVVYL